MTVVSYQEHHPPDVGLGQELVDGSVGRAAVEEPRVTELDDKSM